MKKQAVTFNDRPIAQNMYAQKASKYVWDEKCYNDDLAKIATADADSTPPFP
jgi:hypothetical protein